MYCYIYDAFLRDKRYETTIARIESRLLDLEIQGKAEKLTILKSMKELVDGAIKRGAKTIVAIGDDQTVSKIISIVADKEMTLGMIPIGDHHRIADFLGIPRAEKACDVLSARIVEQLDLGKANNAYFLSFLDIPAAKELRIECDEGKFVIEPSDGNHGISVYNFGAGGHDPRDGILELVIRRQEAPSGASHFFKKSGAEQSIFPLRSMLIKSSRASLPAYADGQTVVKTPLTVTVVPKKLRVIVGKNRQFA